MNKSFYFFTVFIYVLCFLVIPPIFFQFSVEQNAVFVASYPASTFLLGVMAFLLYFFSRKGFVFYENVPSLKKNHFIYFSNAFISFGLLCMISVIFESVSFLFKIDGGIKKVSFPDSPLLFLNFFLGLSSAAFFEEVIYRFYLPKAFFEICMKFFSLKNKKTLFACEALSLIFFALPHFYLGFLGVLNAFFCGLVLRVCMIKTQSIWISFSVHFAYNFLSLLVMHILF